MADLVGLVRAAEATYANRTAVTDRRGSMSFKEVAARSNRAAHALYSLASGGSSNIAMLLGNRAEAVELDVATVKAGLSRVSMNPRLSFDEMRFIVDDSNAGVLVYDLRYSDFADAVALDRPDMAMVCVGDVQAIPSNVTSRYEDLLARASSSPAQYECVGNAASLIMYTSGTTGRPKGAIWTYDSRAAAVQNMLLNELDAESAQVMIHVASISHGSGSKILPVYFRGGRSVLLDRFDPAEFFNSVRVHGGTASFMVPTMIQMLIEGRGSSTMSSLEPMRHISYGGAKMPLATIQQAVEIWGTRFGQVYGSCEAPHPVLYLGRPDHGRPDAAALSSAGRPAIGVDVVLGTSKEPPAPGVEGELFLKSDHLFGGYWGNSDASADSFEDGYFRTGDLGRVHDDGSIEIIGRTKDLIISGGYNVYPAEVERVLLEHPAVRSVCVYGVDDPHWGERVAAAVVFQDRRSASDAELGAHCAIQLAGYKKPRVFRIMRELPLGSTGKVSRKELVQTHETALEASSGGGEK